MIKLYISQPGSGKTKEFIEDANHYVKSAKGNIVFIDESDEGILELHHDIRYINISSYPIDSSQELIAFLYGLMSSNHDIELMYLDGIFNLYMMTDQEACAWLELIEKLSTEHQVAFKISMSRNDDIPSCLLPYIQA